MNSIITLPDFESLARAAAEHLIKLAREAIEARGCFAVALSGGSTPRGAYALLATDELAGQLDWSCIHVFWGDERCVPPDHPDSNYRMARQALLDHVPLPAENIYRIRGELEPEEAAAQYERTLRTFFSASPEQTVPEFDLILLGMGDDGHTASLFPGSAALHERNRWVVASCVDKLGAWRVTLTPVVINSAANVTFLVSGAGKAESLRQVLTGPDQPDHLPAQIVKPDGARPLWMVDGAAASLL